MKVSKIKDIPFIKTTLPIEEINFKRNEKKDIREESRLEAYFNILKKVFYTRTDEDNKLLSAFRIKYFPHYSKAKFKMLSKIFFTATVKEKSQRNKLFVIIVNLIGKGNDSRLLIIAKGRVGVYTKGGRLIDILKTGRMYNEGLMLDEIPVDFITMRETDCILISRSEFVKFLQVI